MRIIQRKKTVKSFYSAVSVLVTITFISSSIIPPTYAQSLPAVVLNLPAPGTMVHLTPGFVPPMVDGITIHPDDPFKFDFLVGRGDQQLEGEAFKAEADKLIKYFLASLTVPEAELWVNLSPYENDRIIPDSLSRTEMGRDLLAQDYILKQLTASLMYPEDELGKKFWNRIYEKIQTQYGVTDIPVDTFNKVWIVPQEATVYETGTSAIVIDSHLKVMLESDYLAMANAKDHNSSAAAQSSPSAAIIKEIIIPEIEKEVNEGATFAPLRQIYNSMILATWYKKNLKESLLGQVYVDQNKVAGIDTVEAGTKDEIYNQYLKAFKVGVYNYIKEDVDPSTQEVIPRKYFAGGITAIDPDNISSPAVNDPGAVARAASRLRDDDTFEVELVGDQGQKLAATVVSPSVAVTPQKDESSSPISESISLDSVIKILPNTFEFGSNSRRYVSAMKLSPEDWDFRFPRELSGVSFEGYRTSPRDWVQNEGKMEIFVRENVSGEEFLKELIKHGYHRNLSVLTDPQLIHWIESLKSESDKIRDRMEEIQIEISNVNASLRLTRGQGGEEIYQRQLDALNDRYQRLEDALARVNKEDDKSGASSPILTAGEKAARQEELLTTKTKVFLADDGTKDTIGGAIASNAFGLKGKTGYAQYQQRFSEGEQRELRRQAHILTATAKTLPYTVVATILSDETAEYRTDDGQNLIDTYVTGRGVGINHKDDRGMVPFGDSKVEKVLNPKVLGSENLAKILSVYPDSISTKTRVQITIDEENRLPSEGNLDQIAEDDARHAEEVLGAGRIPVIEPEILLDGTYDIETSAKVARRAYSKIIDRIHARGLDVTRINFKISFVQPGEKSPNPVSEEEIARETVKMIEDVFPPNFGGIKFLSGGLSSDDAMARMNSVAREANARKLSVPTTISYSRALIGPAYQAWQGKPENFSAAQQVLDITLLRGQAAVVGVLDQFNAMLRRVGADALLEDAALTAYNRMLVANVTAVPLAELEGLVENFQIPGAASSPVDTVKLDTSINYLIGFGRNYFAADGSTGTANSLLASYKVPMIIAGKDASEEEKAMQKQADAPGGANYLKRQAFRNLTFTSPGIEYAYGGIIMYDEAAQYVDPDGNNLVKKHVEERGMAVIHKSDRGLKDDPKSPRPSFETDKNRPKVDAEKIPSEAGLGIGNLEKVMGVYPSSRADKFRVTFTIDTAAGLPTDRNIAAVTERLAQHVLDVQLLGRAATPEPEIIINGDHNIDVAYNVGQRVYTAFFKALRAKEKDGLYMGGVIPKISMVTRGKNAQGKDDPKTVAQYTVKLVEETFPSEIKGLVFLSGGQSSDQAIRNLNAIVKEAKSRGLKRKYRASFSRAAKETALKVLDGKLEDPVMFKAAQKAFSQTAFRIQAASLGVLEEFDGLLERIGVDTFIANVDAYGKMVPSVEGYADNLGQLVKEFQPTNPSASSPVVVIESQNIPVSFARVLRDFGLNLASVSITPLGGNFDVQQVLRDSDHEFAIATAISQAYGTIYYAGQDEKEVSDGVAIHLSNLNIIDYTQRNRNTAVFFLATEGKSDGSFYQKVGAGYYAGFEGGKWEPKDEKNLDEAYAKIEELRKMGVEIKFILIDGLENTNAQAKNKLDAWALFGLIKDSGKTPRFIDDDMRIVSTNWNGPWADVHPLDPPSVSFPKIVKALFAQEHGIDVEEVDTGSQAYKEYFAKFISHVRFHALGPRDPSQKKSDMKSADKRHLGLIEDAKNTYPGIVTYLPGDGNFASRLDASVVPNLDGENGLQTIVTDRGKTAELYMAYIAAVLRKKAGAQMNWMFASENRTSEEVSIKTVGNFTDIDTEMFRRLGYTAEEQRAVHTVEDADFDGIVVETAVTGASEEGFGKEFPKLMRKISESPDGTTNADSLIVIKQGVFVLHTLFKSKNLAETKVKLRAATPEARANLAAKGILPAASSPVVESLKKKFMSGKAISGSDFKKVVNETPMAELKRLLVGKIISKHFRALNSWSTYIVRDIKDTGDRTRTGSWRVRPGQYTSDVSRLEPSAYTMFTLEHRGAGNRVTEQFLPSTIQDDQNIRLGVDLSVEVVDTPNAQLDSEYEQIAGTNIAIGGTAPSDISIRILRPARTWDPKKPHYIILSNKGVRLGRAIKITGGDTDAIMAVFQILQGRPLGRELAFSGPSRLDRIFEKKNMAVTRNHNLVVAEISKAIEGMNAKSLSTASSPVITVEEIERTAKQNGLIPVNAEITPETNMIEFFEGPWIKQYTSMVAFIKFIATKYNLGLTIEEIARIKTFSDFAKIMEQKTAAASSPVVTVEEIVKIAKENGFIPDDVKITAETYFPSNFYHTGGTAIAVYAFLGKLTKTFGIKEITGEEIENSKSFGALARTINNKIASASSPVINGLSTKSPIGVIAQRITREAKAGSGQLNGKAAIRAGANGAFAGHSEARETFGDTDQDVNDQLRFMHELGLKNKLFLFGEPLKIRQQGHQKRYVKGQIIEGLKGLSEEQVADTILGYEPIWAIGTGLKASPKQVQTMSEYIRSIIREMYGNNVARKVRILYGGSVTKDNAEELIRLPEVDGFIPGGASNQIEDIIPIIEIVEKQGPKEGRIPFVAGNNKTKKIIQHYYYGIALKIGEIDQNRVNVGIAPSVGLITEAYLAFNEAVAPPDTKEFSYRDLDTGLRYTYSYDENDKVRKGNLISHVIRSAEGISSEPDRYAEADFYFKGVTTITVFDSSGSELRWDKHSENKTNEARERVRKNKNLVAASPVQRDDFQQGGIDLDAEHLNLDVKRDGTGVPLPVSVRPIETIRINGLVPVIINITPVNLPLLLGGAVSGDEEPNDLSWRPLDPVDLKARFEAEDTEQVAVLN